MKLVIYTVSEKRPPVDEDIILYDIVDGEIQNMEFAQAHIAIPENDEERALVPTGTVEDLIWSKDSSTLADDMRFSDHWSFSVTSNGN